jgi:hypothetical protein
MHERRQTDRKKTFIGGLIVFNRRQATMDCVLRNMGERGAKVAFHNAAVVPDRFAVEVARMDRTFQARVVWRGQDELGIVFDDPHTTNVIPLDVAVRMQKLQAEKDRLERRVLELSSASESAKPG